jgi:hypothetical protein
MIRKKYTFDTINQRTIFEKLTFFIGRTLDFQRINMKKFDQFTCLLGGQVKIFRTILMISTEKDRNVWITHIDNELGNIVIVSNVDKRTIDGLKIE